MASEDSPIDVQIHYPKGYQFGRTGAGEQLDLDKRPDYVLEVRKNGRYSCIWHWDNPVPFYRLTDLEPPDEA